VPAQTAVRTLKLRVFSQTFSYPPYNSVRAVRTGPSFVVQPGGTLGAETLVDVPVRLRIDAGQLVGVDTQYPFDFNGFGGNQLLLFQPPPADGAEAYGNTFGAISMNVNVGPDADVDFYGDETQDCRPNDPGRHESCAPPPQSPFIPPPGGAGADGVRRRARRREEGAHPVQPQG